MPIAGSRKSLAFKPFGADGNLPAALDSAVTIENDGELDGFSAVGFVIVPPDGGEVKFEGSFDGVRWEGMSFKCTTLDIKTSRISHAEMVAAGAAALLFNGSISSMRMFRCRVISAGTSPGVFHGNMSRETSTQENIESGAAPHESGYVIRNAAVDLTASGETTVVTPTAGKRLIVTKVAASILGITAGSIALYFGIDTPANRVHKEFIDVGAAVGDRFQTLFLNGRIAAAIDSPLKVNLIGTIGDIALTVDYYEIF